MKKQRNPAYQPKRRRNSGLRSFFVTLLGSAAIAVLGAGVWQLLDPVEYQPPLAPLTSSTVASAASQSEKTPDAPPEEASSGEDSSQEDPPESKGDAGDPEVGEGEWLSSSYFDDALFVGDSITEGIKLYDVMNNATVLSSTGVNLDSLYTKAAITLADGSKGYSYFVYAELRLRRNQNDSPMRYISFEELAGHIRALIDEGRYLAPEELAQVRGQEAPAPQTPAKPAPKEKREGWRCQFCGAVFQKRPDVCGVCKAIGAFEYVEYYE